MSTMYERVNVYSFNSLEEFLNGYSGEIEDAFSWTSTIQGGKFWEDVYDREYCPDDLDPRDHQWLLGLERHG